MTPQIDTAWLDAEFRRLLDFGRNVGLPDGGAGYLDDRGVVDPVHGVQTYITARMAHVYCVGALAGVPGCLPVADAALAGLAGRLADEQCGGWFHALSDGVPDVTKTCYDHAFVMLAASSAVVAERPGAEALLARATATFLEHFWDDDAGLVVDTWDREFRAADAYRGLNSTMHSVEAMLSVASAVGGDEGLAWVARAERAARFVAQLSTGYDGRLPEHFNSDWVPDLELNRDRPGDQFKPYGATPGHGLEWARLLLHTRAALGDDDAELLAAAVRLFARAVADGWAADGADGFCYTTDWAGAPVVRDRMHWVVAEGINTAAVLAQVTDGTAAGQPSGYTDWYQAWWAYADRYLIDREGGSWWHELDPSNRPARTVWPGKPDLYHVVQATLVPRLPRWPMVAAAVRS